MRFKKKLAENELNDSNRNAMNLSNGLSPSSSLSLSQTLNHLQLFLNNNNNNNSLSSSSSSSFSSTSSDAFEIAIPLTFNTNYNTSNSTTSINFEQNSVTNPNNKTIRQLTSEQSLLKAAPVKIGGDGDDLALYAALPFEYHNHNNCGQKQSILAKESNQINFSNEIEMKSHESSSVEAKENSSKIKLPGARKLYKRILN